MNTPKNKRQFHIPFTLALVVLFFCLCLDGCGQKQSLSNGLTIDPDSTEAGSRDNSIRVLTPEASGQILYECKGAYIDASHTDCGYVCVCYSGSNPKVKLQVTGPDAITYTYNLHGSQEFFPLSAGDGKYTLSIYESVDIANSQYSLLLSQDIDVALSDEFGPFLYPSQYVNYTADTQVVQATPEIIQAANTDLDAVSLIYNYVISNYSYDYEKAKTIESGYLPDLDSFYQTKKGICFDYASMMSAMLRSQGIPTRLEVGYLDQEYHAWISVYIDEVGWINGIIAFDGKSWSLLDPTYAATSKKPTSFTADSSKYLTKYIY